MPVPDLLRKTAAVRSPHNAETFRAAVVASGPFDQIFVRKMLFELREDGWQQIGKPKSQSLQKSLTQKQMLAKADLFAIPDHFFAKSTSQQCRLDKAFGSIRALR